MSRSRNLRAAISNLSGSRPTAESGAEGATPTKLLLLVGNVEPPEGAHQGSEWAHLRLADLDAGATDQRWDEVVVATGSIAELRGVLPWLECAGRSKRVTLWVRTTDRAHRLQAPTSIGQATVSEACLQRGNDAGRASTVRVRMSKPIGVADVARAAVAAPVGGGRSGSAGGLRLGVASVEASWWTAGDPAARLLSDTTDLQDPNRVPAFDVFVGAGVPVGAARDLPSVRLDEGLQLPPVDIAVCSPVGFAPAGELRGELARSDTGEWTVRAGDDVLLGTDATTGLTENHVRQLRPLRLVHVASEETAADLPGLGRVLSQLCCAGVPVSAPHLPAALIDALGPELTTRLRSLDPTSLCDPVGRDAWSVRTRRLALSRFTGSSTWAMRLPSLRSALLPPPSVSVLMATRRPALLPFALAQIARQDWPDLEVVLVLHGSPAGTAEVQAALSGFPGRITVIEAATGLSFGQVLNAGLTACSGLLVTKMDDDDWYGPHHITDLVQAHAYSGATLVGAAGYYVYLSRSDLTVRFTSRPTEAPSSWVVGATNLLATADLTSLGGWRSLPFGEDATLYRAVEAAGGSIYGCHDLGFTYFRGRDHTWSPPDGDTRWLHERYSREVGFRPPPEVHPLPHPSMAAQDG